jgi:hypothetical protein
MMFGIFINFHLITAAIYLFNKSASTQDCIALNARMIGKLDLKDYDDGTLVQILCFWTG